MVDPQVLNVLEKECDRILKGFEAGEIEFNEPGVVTLGFSPPTDPKYMPWLNVKPADEMAGSFFNLKKDELKALV